MEEKKKFLQFLNDEYWFLIFDMNKVTIECNKICSNKGREVGEKGGDEDEDEVWKKDDG